MHLFILLFFGTAFAVGLYCLWAAVLVEVNRTPKSMRFKPDPALHQSIKAPSGHSVSQAR